MKRKINKKKLIICIIILIILTSSPVFGRYIYNSVKDLYLKSRNFSFSSDLLTTAGKTYKYSNWSGVDTYEIDFQLYSYENELSLFSYEGDGLGYTVTCTVDDPTKATVHVGTEAGEATNTSYIPNLTNVKDVKVYLRPTGNLVDGDTVKLTITASTSEPYVKTISATFIIRIAIHSNVTYSIDDSEGSIYATLKLINTASESTKLGLTFRPYYLRIDETNPYCENALVKEYVTVTETIKQVTTNEDGDEVVEDVEVDVQYINYIVIEMEPEDVATIRFYKQDTSVDYTYPGGSYGSLIVNVNEKVETLTETENNEEET